MICSYFNLNISCFEVKSDLKLQVLNNGSEYFEPVFLQWCVAVGRNRDFPHFICTSLENQTETVRASC